MTRNIEKEEIEKRVSASEERGQRKVEREKEEKDRVNVKRQRKEPTKKVSEIKEEEEEKLVDENNPLITSFL